MQLVNELLGFVAVHPVLAAVASLAGLLLFLGLAFPDRALGLRRRKDVPHLQEGLLPLIGNTLYLLKSQTTLHDRLYEWALRYGDVVRVSMLTPTRPIDMVATFNVKDVQHILSEPFIYEKGFDQREFTRDLFGHGIFAEDGDKWRVQRKVASRIFNLAQFRDHNLPVFVHDAERVAFHLGEAAKSNACIDLHDLLLRSTLCSFVKLSMGSELGCLDGTGKVVDGRYVLPEVAYATAFDRLNGIVSLRSVNPLWMVTEKLDGTAREVKRCQAVLDGFAQKVIGKKRADRAKGASGADKAGSDLLDHFLALSYEDGSELTDEALRDVVRNFIVAGRDTTAQTLACEWLTSRYLTRSIPKQTSFYSRGLLEARSSARSVGSGPPPFRPFSNPLLLYSENKLRAEFLSVLGPTSMPSYTNLASLKYGQATFNEVLRLHANVPANLKVPSQDDVLPGTGTKVYRGQRVVFSPYVMGRLESVWGPDALEMKPERWLDKSGELVKESHFKWCVPRGMIAFSELTRFFGRPVFNAGPRMCLGINSGFSIWSIFPDSTDGPLPIFSGDSRGYGSVVNDRTAVPSRAVQRRRAAKVGRLGQGPGKAQGVSGCWYWQASGSDSNAFFSRRYDMQLTLAARGGIDFLVHRV